MKKYKSLCSKKKWTPYPELFLALKDEACQLWRERTEARQTEGKRYSRECWRLALQHMMMADSVFKCLIPVAAWFFIYQRSSCDCARNLGRLTATHKGSSALLHDDTAKDLVCLKGLAVLMLRISLQKILTKGVCPEE